MSCCIRLFFYFLVLTSTGLAFEAKTPATLESAPLDFIGDVPENCRKSFENSWQNIPENIRACVLNSQSRIGFKQVTFEYMSSLKYSSWTTGTPTMACDGRTIISNSDYCSLYDDNLTHEIGHAIHNVIQANYPAIFQEFQDLWHSAHKSAGGVGFNGTNSPDLSKYISWKDTQDPYEGFAEVVKYLSRPDFQTSDDPIVKSKLEFGRKIVCKKIK